MSSHNSSNEFKRLQSTLIQRMKEELGGATFDSEGLFNDMYPPIPSFDSDAFFSDFTKKFNPNFPSSSDEERFYLPLSRFLNNLHSHIEQKKYLSNSIYEGVRFEAYNRAMADSPGNEEPLKPDLIARIPSSNRRASWQEVEFFVEVKSDFSALVAQAATYARAIFGLQRNRLFVLALFFDHKALEISFGIFHPMGLIFPKERYSLNNPRGYRQFILAMARVYASPQRRSVGFNQYSNNRVCHIPEYGTYLYDHTICYRNTVRGRQTRVDEMKLIHLPTPLPTPLPPQPKLDRSHPYRLRSIMSPPSQSASTSTPSQSATASRLPLPPLKVFQKGLSPPSPKGKLEPENADFLPAYLPLAQPSASAAKDAPESLILKDSWALLSQWDMESRMFEAVKGTFGTPCVRRAYQVSDWEVGLLTSRDDLEKRAMWGYAGADPEPRVRVRLPILTRGIPLTEAKSPQALVLGVVHAMVGHWHLRAGWLHRDVNIGNILLRETTAQDLPIEGLGLANDSLAHFSECTSFITDGDLAIEWQKELDPFSPSGTLPFVSVKMLAAVVHPFADDSDYSYRHTAVDDLESFVWVTIWAIMEIIPRDTWTRLEISIHDFLNADTPSELLKKRIILDDLSEIPEVDPIIGHHISPGLNVFIPLLTNWLTASKRAAVYMNKVRYNPPNPLEHYRELYCEYISLALKLVDQLPDNWDCLRSATIVPVEGSPVTV